MGDMLASLDEDRDEGPHHIRYGALVTETETAWLLELRDPRDKNYAGDKRYATDFDWFPKSYCQLVEQGEQKLVQLPRWLLRDKALEKWEIL